jgi:2-hydroxychromene-2-carboxylate isomerase
MLDFFFDVGSPYSYLCATQIDGVAGKHGATVRWRPFLLGAVFKAAGNDQTFRVPTKAKWMLDDLKQWAELYDEPFQFPALFPANTIRAMRACCFAETKDRVRGMAMALFSGYWTRGIDPSSEEGIRQGCMTAGLDPVEVFAAVESQPIKDKLRAHTDDALKAGAFGAPTILCDGKLLWGNDRLVILDHLLAKANG